MMTLGYSRTRYCLNEQQGFAAVVEAGWYAVDIRITYGQSASVSRTIAPQVTPISYSLPSMDE